MRVSLNGRSGRCALAVTALLPLAAPVRGQDAHYWTDQFGARSDLLGGLVVGDVADPSAAFYNPGALGIVEEPAFLLSANGFQYERLAVGGRSGDSPDLVGGRIDATPDVIAGNLPFDWLGRSRVSYSAFTRVRQKLELEGRTVDDGSILDTAPDTAGVVRESVLDHRVTETWAGVTWGYPVAPRVGIGVTTFVAVRGQTTRTRLTDERFEGGGAVAGVLASSDLRYTSWRLLWKAGVQARAGQWRLGASVTTPAVYLYGSGAWASNVTRFDAAVDPGGSGTDPVLAATDQQGLSARYRSSWAAAAGATLRTGRSAIHTTVEWFDGPGTYDVVAAHPYQVQSPEGTVDPEIRSSLSDVVNAGVGLEWSFSADVIGYTSVRTDFSAAPDDVRDVHLSAWDLYHATAGAALRFSQVDLTLGLGFSYGHANLRDPGDFRLAPPVSSIDATSVTYVRVRGLVGFQYFFGRSSAPQPG